MLSFLISSAESSSWRFRALRERLLRRAGSAGRGACDPAWRAPRCSGPSGGLLLFATRRVHAAFAGSRFPRCRRAARGLRGPERPRLGLPLRETGLDGAAAMRGWAPRGRRRTRLCFWGGRVSLRSPLLGSPRRSGYTRASPESVPAFPFCRVGRGVDGMEACRANTSAA